MTSALTLFSIATPSPSRTLNLGASQRLLRLQAEINHVGQNLEMPLRLLHRAHHAVAYVEFAVARDHAGH